MILGRRDLLPILAAGALSARQILANHLHAGGSPIDFSGYRPRAFTSDEFTLLDAITETIFPADDSGPGAHAAHVNYYLDTLLHYRSADEQARWREGLAAINSATVDAHGKAYAACSPAQQYAVLAKIAAQEFDPKMPVEIFFGELKAVSLEAFYASEVIQREHLGYRGNTAIAEFPGCTHE
jgi:gluconate 2-dehydrogenase gamma chain